MTREPQTPVGKVTYAGGGIIAELLGLDEWRVTVEGKDSPAMARSLADLYRDHYQGPQDGYYGQRILNDLAERMNGTAEFYDEEPLDPDVVY